VAPAGKQPRNHVQNRTCLQRRAGVRARGGNRLANQVSNEEILRGSTPLCLAERLAEICSLFRIFGYVFDFVVPPHGLQVKPFFKGFASLNLPPRYTRLEPRSLLMLCRCEASDQSKIFVLQIGVFTEASADVPV